MKKLLPSQIDTERVVPVLLRAYVWGNLRAVLAQLVKFLKLRLMISAV